MIVLITPTGARTEQIQICAKLMKAQDYPGEVLWIIIDDCDPRTTDFITDNFKNNWTIKKIYPVPLWQVGQNTQGRNICTGIEESKKHNPEAIFIIEDDDYYKPCYLRMMMGKIKGYDLAGQINTVYYNVIHRRWIENKNDVWSSLFQTAFTMNAIPVLEKLYREKFIDFIFFRQVKKVNLFDGEKLSIGIKGIQGRSPIGAGHSWVSNLESDGNMSKLKEMIGEDYKHYEKFYLK